MPTPPLPPRRIRYRTINATEDVAAGTPYYHNLFTNESRWLFPINEPADTQIDEPEDLRFCEVLMRAYLSGDIET